MYIVSACLAGIDSRYDSSNREDEAVVRLVADGRAIPLCPEQLGGLPTPRAKINLCNGDGNAIVDGLGDVRAIGTDGVDYTENLMRGAREILKIARLVNLEGVIFKDGSPSCGVRYIWTEKGRVSGCGVTTALLRRNGIEVIPSTLLTKKGK